jgi:POT family proton-dependent oligopeptide transporter
MFLATLIFWMGRKKFVHVPPKPGGKLGLLDTLSSICLLMAAGHLFFTWGQPWWVLLLATASFLAVGLGLFSVRQRLEPDNGFLAIVLYSAREWFVGGPPSPAPGPDPAGGGLSAEEAEESPLARSPFWGPSVRRFGLEATEGPVAVLKIISVFFLALVFWALFDQHSSSWIRQAEMMDLRLLGGWHIPASNVSWLDAVITRLNDVTFLATQVPMLNPLLVMILIPLMNPLYARIDRLGIQTTRFRRITAGMLIAALSFVAVALLQWRIDAAGAGRVWVGWQVIPYVIITVAEVMVSITALEFAYTQAPRRMKSTVMSFWNLTVALGNLLTALVARYAQLPLADFFWVFAGLMAAAAVLFGIRGYFYVQKDYTQT